MKLKYYYFTIFMLIIIFVGNTNTVKAQWSPPTTIRTPYGNATLPGNYFPNNTFFLNNSPINKKYVYSIVLLNDSIVTVKTKLNIDYRKLHSDITWKEGKGANKKTKIIKPNETKEIYRTNLDGEKIIGIPTDTTWIFLVDEEKIRTYSINSDIMYPTITNIQLDKDGKILKLNQENLKNMIEDPDHKLEKYINKNKLFKAIDYYNKKSKTKDPK